MWRKHRVFAIALAAGTTLRLATMLGFRPALLPEDSFAYLHDSVTLIPDPTRPMGYPALLLILSPLHSLDVVTVAAHVAGLGIAVSIYALLRRYGLPGWGAALSVAPVLFDPRQIWLEQAILADTQFEVLVVAAVLMLARRGTPSVRQATVAGLAVALAGLTRGNGIALVVVIVAYLLIRRAGWRAASAAALACALPLCGYLVASRLAQGTFALTNSDGMFLWSRTMSFADCAKIKPPPDLVPLCRENQPDANRSPAPKWSWGFQVSDRKPADYLWAPNAWWRTGSRPGFTARNNHLAMQFALKAISAQPLDFARVVAKDVMLTFVNTDHAMEFPAGPYLPHLSGSDTTALRQYAHTVSNTHAVQPWASFMFTYQQRVRLPGVLFFLIMLAGLGGVIRNWRRAGGPALLPWVTAAAIVVVPVALHEYSYRYALPAVSLACMAAALSLTHAPADKGRGC